MVVKHSVVITVTVHVKELAIMHVTILVPMIVVLDALAIARVLVLEHLQAHPLVHTVTIPVKEIVRELVLEPLKVQPLVLDQVVRQAALISVQLLVDTHATIPAMTPARTLLQDLHVLPVIPHVRAAAIQNVRQHVKEHPNHQDAEVYAMVHVREIALHVLAAVKIVVLAIAEVHVIVVSVLVHVMEHAKIIATKPVTQVVLV